jgi:methylated-DNA-[protein]-cysteine S-methyltransferase
MPENSFYYNSPVGALYIASNETGITTVSFVNRENKQVMEETLIDYTKPVEGVLLSCFNQLEAYFDGKLRDFDLPLAQQGTEFQQSV